MGFNYDKLFELKGKEPYTFSNWKEIMEFVGAPTTLDGNSKRKFQNNVKRYAEYHKEGYKIVIDKIKDTVNPEMNTRGSKYQKYSVEVLKCVLMDDGSDFSVMKLGELLGCINKGYRYAYTHRRKISKELGIDINVVNDFFDTTHSRIKGIVEGALEKLVEVGLIEYEIRLKGSYVTGEVALNLKYNENSDEEYVSGEPDITEGYQFLNEQEVEIYEQEKEELLQKYKVDSERELYTKRKNVTAFYRELNKGVFEKIHIRNVYDSYVITKKREYETVSPVEKATAMICINDIASESVLTSTGKKVRKNQEEIELYEDALKLGIVEDVDGVRKSNEWRTEQIEKDKERYTLIDKYIKIQLEDM